MEKIIRQTFQTIARLTQSQRIAIFNILNEKTCGVIGVIKKGEFFSHSGDKKISFQNTPFGTIISSNETHTYSGGMIKKWGLPFPSYKKNNSNYDCLCIPLLGGEEKVVTGIIVVTQQIGITLAPARLQMLKMLTPLIATILEEMLDGQKDKIQSATTDDLTNLYTRFYFDLRLQEEVTRVHRHGGVFSILLINIDHFNKIHENNGHIEAKRVLQQIANLLNQSIREEIDIPCRYVGHKFIALLPHTNVDGAYILGERIRRRSEQSFFGRLDGLQIKITLSIGIAHNVDIVHSELDQDNISTEISKEEVMYRANTMLQTAQRAGHNQVMVWW